MRMMESKGFSKDLLNPKKRVILQNKQLKTELATDTKEEAVVYSNLTILKKYY